MNDYLNNLAARTLGQFPVVEPRLASRFEQSEAPPIAAGSATLLSRPGDSPGPDPWELEQEIATDAANNPASKTTPAKRRTTRAAHPAEQEELTDTAARHAPDAHQLPPLTIAPSITATPAQPNLAPQPQLTTKQEANAASWFPPSQTPTGAPETNRTAEIEKLFSELAMLRQEGLPPQENQRAEPALSVKSVEQPQQKKEPTGNPLMTSSAAPRQPAPWPTAVPVATPVLPPLPAVERQPVVKVTIGRVEVRAVISTPTATVVSAAEKTPPPQALPLNEYLRRRANGEL